jgi:hypothetical protein
MVHAKGKVVPMPDMKTWRGSRYIVPLVLNISSRWRWVVSIRLRQLFPWSKNPSITHWIKSLGGTASVSDRVGQEEVIHFYMHFRYNLSNLRIYCATTGRDDLVAIISVYSMHFIQRTRKTTNATLTRRRYAVLCLVCRRIAGILRPSLAVLSVIYYYKWINSN